MNSLILHDSFECYYAGRGVVPRASVVPSLASDKPARVPSLLRERLLPVRLSDLRHVKKARPA